MIVLDATLRDGGYYLNWEFDIDLANKYLKTMEESKVDAVEVGFRSIPGKPVGIFAHVTDQFIESALYTPNIKYFGVMINASDMNINYIKTLFTYADKAPINLVRVAVHFKDVVSCEFICKELKDLGYVVTCNLMQVADKSFDDIVKAAKIIEDWGVVDVLYLADSLGGMGSDDIDYAFKAVKNGWGGLTGFHGHNNKNQALSNSLEAIDIGVDWVDGTVLGMGRGPGNTEIEYLLGELNKRGFGEFNLTPIYKLALDKFLCLKHQYKWGSSLLYYLAAEYNIHPTFIQKMLVGGNDMSLILEAVFRLKDRKAMFFSESLFKEVL